MPFFEDLWQRARRRRPPETGAQTGAERGAETATSWSIDELTNLPLQQVQAGQVGDAIATLTNLAFLDARLAHDAAPSLIARTVQDFDAVDAAASPAQRAQLRPHRFMWATIEHALLALVRDPTAIERRKLCISSFGTARRQHRATRSAPPPGCRRRAAARRRRSCAS